ncbi:helix-turn-helix domain-containing protein [Mycobacteroides abscessus]|uniref:helix-turn-helix domain-containing protein n=1 Tax=Mycobacteroides abscessus TaxID=36809 RepID=UPI0019D18DFB|nr:helix-turn-helix domain-containing protein [Mycobacteroides abscessus]MBN7412666.1 helix-turn-helix domain-containing protein [Mycobacteroides abscessus subsp. abscessus]
MAQKISIPEVAEKFGVSPRTIRRYIAAGRLTAYRVGPRLIRVDVNEAQKQLLRSSTAKR